MGEKIPSIHKNSQYNYNKTNPNKTVYIIHGTEHFMYLCIQIKNKCLSTFYNDHGGFLALHHYRFRSQNYWFDCLSK